MVRQFGLARRPDVQAAIPSSTQPTDCSSRLRCRLCSALTEVEYLECVVIADRWGVTEAEVARWYPCDEFVAVPVFQAWRGVSVRCAPEQLWPWVAQIRLAPYSYDWIDNLGRRSPRELRNLREPVVGEPLTASASRPIGRILSVDVGKQLTGRIGWVHLSYVLVPIGDETRLLLKLASSTGRLVAPFLSVGDLVMARRQLLNLKQLAERTA